MMHLGSFVLYVVTVQLHLKYKLYNINHSHAQDTDKRHSSNVVVLLFGGKRPKSPDF